MVKKCLIPGCNPNYRSRKGGVMIEEKRPVFRLPKDPAERTVWMNSMPYKDLKTSKDTVVCEKHWLKSYPIIPL